MQQTDLKILSLFRLILLWEAKSLPLRAKSIKNVDVLDSLPIKNLHLTKVAKEVKRVFSSPKYSFVTSV